MGCYQYECLGGTDGIIAEEHGPRGESELLSAISQELSLFVQVGKCSRVHVRPLSALYPSVPSSTSSPLPFSTPPRPPPPALAAIRYFIPSFGGKSYLAFKMMKAYHTVRIAMEFRTVELSGLLLYNGQNRGKDFISLALVGGFVELRWVPFPSALCGKGESKAAALARMVLAQHCEGVGLELAG